MKLRIPSSSRTIYNVDSCKPGQVYLKLGAAQQEEKLYFRTAFAGTNIMINLETGNFTERGKFVLLPDAIIFPYGE